jgi:hypothetical protein
VGPELSRCVRKKDRRLFGLALGCGGIYSFSSFFKVKFEQLNLNMYFIYLKQQLKSRYVRNEYWHMALSKYWR